MYMYDRDCLGRMDEETPVRPTSRKGRVRAEIAQMLFDAVGAGEVEALIARAADFYGPGRQAHSVLTQTVFERLANGRSGQWLLSADRRHSFTYTPDAALGTALLGNAGDTWGEVWHLPTAADPPTGREWIELIAAGLGVEPKVQVASELMLRAMGLFVPALREVREMAYQYDRDYVFLSDKFNARFDFAPTAWADGIRAVIEADYR
jgi:nucleoside-diphosphate-sugar epimerase